MASHISSISSDNISVSNFYDGKSVFVTGGSGFMGKVLIEKLLRSCTGIGNIYLLIRPKRGQDINVRLQQMFDTPLFEKLRLENGRALEKVVPVLGDVGEPEMGLSKFDQELLANNISIVFHFAATVKFDEPLKQAIAINVLGTKRLVQLCRTMDKLEALIHVSTVFSNCDSEQIKEEIYPFPFDPDNIIRAVEWMDDELLQLLTPKLLGEKPNTYTFTKSLTEHLLLNEGGNLPIAIIRPSVVLSSVSEPMAGWIDNWYGPTGVIAATGKGIYRTMYCPDHNVAYIIPVDFVTNLIISSAWKTAVTRPSKITVYNCSTNQKSPITWNIFFAQCLLTSRKFPLNDIIWYPGGSLKSNYVWDKVCIYLQHYVPAILIDTSSWVIGKKPFMMKVQQQLNKAFVCIRYFTTKRWHIVDDNTVNLYQSLSPEDKKIFPFDMNSINWSSYIDSYILGIRHYIFKQSPAHLDKAKKNLKRFYYIHKCCQLVGVVLLCSFVMFKANLI